MTKILFVFGAFLLVHSLDLSESAEKVQCIPLSECQKFLDLLKEKPVSQTTIKLLKTSHCGFNGNNPRVWCPQDVTTNCQTPEGELGKCTPVKECQSFLEILNTSNKLPLDTVSYLQKFQCDEPNSSGSTISVCCSIAQESSPTIRPYNTNQFSSIPKQPTNTIRPSSNRPSFLPRPSEGECGRQSVRLVNKIIGGTTTEMDEFPWTVLLEYHLGTRSSTSCAGTLISKKYVVTAAHCTDNTAIRRVGNLTNVILGEFDTRTEKDCIIHSGGEDCSDPVVKVPVETIILHPQWYTRPKASINHDIALLRLSESVTFTDYIKPICLPSPTLVVKENDNMVVTGWGQTEYGVSSSVKLKTTISVANRDTCVQKYKAEKYLVVGEGEICVGGEEGRDSCSGDSGGPLMLPVNRNGGEIWFLAGVVSFGLNNPCGRQGYPGLYTYLPNYIDWIYQTVRQ